jgi:hypothetical protein
MNGVVRISIHPRRISFESAVGFATEGHLRQLCFMVFLVVTNRQTQELRFLHLAYGVKPI